MGVMPAQTVSWYSATAIPTPALPPLQGDLDTDVCIVGGGLTGCSAALHLAERGYRVTLLEAERIAFGASGRSGGQMIAGFNRDIAAIARLTGPEDARRLWDLCEEALDLTRTLIRTHAIPCDFRDGTVFVGEKARHRADIDATYEEWTRLGRRDLVVWDRAETQRQVASQCYSSGLYDPHGGHLHPLNYTLGLAAAARAAGAQMYEKTPMLRWQAGDPARVETPQGTVRAKFILLAGNAYLWATERRLGRRIMPVGTYIAATEPLGEARAHALIRSGAAVCDMNFVLNYFRLSSDHRLLFGGRVSYSRLDPADVGAAIRRTMLRYLPQLADTRMEYAWGGHVAITVNRLPHFGRLAPNVLFAQGYSGHGIALTGLAGRLMAEAVAGQAERFDVFSRIPHLPFPGGTALRTPLLVLAMAWHRLRDLL